MTRKLDELTHYIISNNTIFKAQYDEICELRFMYNQLLHSEESVYGNFQITSYMKQVNDKVEYAVGNEILRIIKAEKMAGHFDEWQYTDVPNFDSITDEAEVHHDEAPPFSMISLIQTRALIETLSLIPIMTCLTVRHLYHESCISAHLQ